MSQFENISVHKWVDEIEKSIKSVKEQKKELRNEINELRLGLQILDLDLDKEVNLIENERITLKDPTYDTQVQICNTDLEIVSASISKLTERFSEILQSMVSFSASLDILEDKSVKK